MTQVPPKARSSSPTVVVQRFQLASVAILAIVLGSGALLFGRRLLYQQQEETFQNVQPRSTSQSDSSSTADIVTKKLREHSQAPPVSTTQQKQSFITTALNQGYVLPSTIPPEPTKVVQSSISIPQPSLLPIPQPSPTPDPEQSAAKTIDAILHPSSRRADPEPP